MFGAINSRLFASRSRPGFPPGAGQAFEEDAQAPVGVIRKVLVVDDEADVADLAEVLLCAHGFEALVAYSGTDALALLAAHPDIDAVVSDVMMPGMNGLDLAEQINERYPKVKVVLASGYMAPAMFQDRPLTQLFIAKPYRMEQLMKLLRT